MRRYLVVANRTLVDEGVLSEIRECVDRERCRVHIVVPASPPRGSLTWTEGGARNEALDRLAYARTWFGERGLSASGEVSDSDPVDAVGDVLRREPFEEIVLSTFPTGLSRWLRQDLPHRLGRSFGLPVRHVVAGAAAQLQAA